MLPRPLQNAHQKLAIHLDERIDRPPHDQPPGHCADWTPGPIAVPTRYTHAHVGVDAGIGYGVDAMTNTRITPRARALAARYTHWNDIRRFSHTM